MLFISLIKTSDNIHVITQSIPYEIVNRILRMLFKFLGMKFENFIILDYFYILSTEMTQLLQLTYYFNHVKDEKFILI